MTTPAFEAERRASREGAAVRARPDLAAISVTGRDRLKWLNGLVTCELATRKAGEGAYGLAVGKTGKIFTELWFLVEGDEVLVIAPRDRMEMLREHFDKHLIMEDAEMSETLAREVVFAIGPRAAEIVTAARAEGAVGAMIDWTGSGDAAVLLAAEGREATLRAAIFALAGPIVEIGEEAWEALRVERGWPRFGVDFDEQSLPQEASLEKVAVSFSKGCYLGQETVFMLEKRGHAKKRLMRLHVDGDGDVAPGAELALPDGGAVVGAVTSRTPAPEGGVTALGHVKYKHAVPGVSLTLSGRAVKVLGPASEPEAAAPAPRA